MYSVSFSSSFFFFFLQVAELNAKVKDLDAARAASEDLILSLSAEKTRMLGSSGEASETIDELVDEYSRLVSKGDVCGVGGWMDGRGEALMFYME